MVLEGHLGWAIVALAGPSMLSMMLAVVGGMMSALFLGRIVGTIGLALAASIAAVELCVSVVFQALANGTMSLLSREIGAGSERAGRIVQSSLLLTALVGCVLCVLGLALCDPLSVLLSDNADLQPLLRAYLIGLAFATTPVGLATVGIAIFAAAGWAQVAFWRGIVEIVLLAVLTPLFIDQLGVIGAPLAQCVASCAAIAWMAWTLWTGWTDLRLGVRPSKLFVADRGVWRSIAKIGGPPQIGRLTNFVAFGFIVGLVLRESAMLAAAFGVAYRLLTVASTAGYGFSRAQAIIAGQCIGAGKHDRAIASLWVACMLALIVGLALIVLAPLATPLVRLFTTDVRVVAATMDALASWRWIVLAASAWYIFLAA
ncbi:MAG TPA: MATE family efflux transporter, partial [Kofleriaceae bacterium]|nr:MATE family efflux transporter [Kofleriaceae bacterium]